MPHCFVLQPNGKYAIWSTIVDTFLMIDGTREEVLDHEVSERNSRGYPGGIDNLRRHCEEEFKHIEESGIAYDWAYDWNRCLRWLEGGHGENNSEVMKTIDAFKLPHRMKRKISPYRREKYWHYYWRNRCIDLEAKRV
jgi:hypothetical protein